MSFCLITVNTGDPHMRIEGDYVRQFYDRLKTMVPKHLRGWFPSGMYWQIDSRFFCPVFELAWRYFSRIQLIENGRAEEYVTGKGLGQ